MFIPIILVAIGGAWGALSRFLLQELLISFHCASVYAIMLINILGAFGLGCLSQNPSANVYLFATGFLASFTTFSTLCGNSVNLFAEGKIISSILYPIISVSIGIIFFICGMKLGNLLLKS